jgi:23S rRNA (guanosine2251-2'-O)-methyltransferase
VNHGPDKVIGRIPVLECLRVGKRPATRLYLLKSGKDLDAIRAAAASTPILEVPRDQLDRMTDGAHHQGVLLETGPLPLLTVDQWLESTNEPQLMAVILDGIEDPHNFGAIIRSAAACGAGAVIFGKDRSAPLSAVTAKAAAGAIDHISLVQEVNLVRAIQKLQAAGFWVAALDAGGETILWKADLRGRMALVVGSEGKGVRRLVSETCDLRIQIPLHGPITSLNASVSAAVALAEWMRQRHLNPGG